MNTERSAARRCLGKTQTAFGNVHAADEFAVNTTLTADTMLLLLTQAGSSFDVVSDVRQLPSGLAPSSPFASPTHPFNINQPPQALSQTAYK